MSSGALTQQTRTDAAHKTTRTLKILKRRTKRTAHGRIIPLARPSSEARQQARRTIRASSGPCESPESRQVLFLQSESQPVGFISFAAARTTTGSQGLHAAKVMKPLSELNRELNLTLEWVLLCSEAREGGSWNRMGRVWACGGRGGGSRG